MKDRNYFTIRIGVTAAQIQAGGYIGVIPVNDCLTLEVAPRVPLANLPRLLEISRMAPTAVAEAYRLYDDEGQFYPSLTAVYSSGLRKELEYILSRGMYRQYERIADITSFPRGRVEMNKTLQQIARGASHKLAVSCFQRSVDNAPNRCLLFAVHTLSQYTARIGDILPHRQRRSVQRDLNYCLHLLRGVELDATQHFLRDGLVTGQHNFPTVRAYYRSALDLALAIIGRRAVLVERGGSLFRLPCLVIDMSRVFESYLRELLRAAACSGGWRWNVVDGNKKPPVGGKALIFHTGVPVAVSPDILLRERQRQRISYPLLIEVKYKPARGLPDKDDLNQAIAYGMAYRARHVVIAQPRAEPSSLTPGLHVLGTVGELGVSQYVIDLSSSVLEQEEQHMCEEIRRLAEL